MWARLSGASPIFTGNSPQRLKVVDRRRGNRALYLPVIPRLELKGILIRKPAFHFSQSYAVDSTFGEEVLQPMDVIVAVDDVLLAYQRAEER